MTFDVSDWLTKIDQALEIAQEYIAKKTRAICEID